MPDTYTYTLVRGDALSDTTYPSLSDDLVHTLTSDNPDGYYAVVRDANGTVTSVLDGYVEDNTFVPTQENNIIYGPNGPNTPTSSFTSTTEGLLASIAIQTAPDGTLIIASPALDGVESPRVSPSSGPDHTPDPQPMQFRFAIESSGPDRRLDPQPMVVDEPYEPYQDYPDITAAIEGQLQNGSPEITTVRTVEETTTLEVTAARRTELNGERARLVAEQREAQERAAQLQAQIDARRAEIAEEIGSPVIPPFTAPTSAEQQQLTDYQNLSDQILEATNAEQANLRAMAANLRRDSAVNGGIEFDDDGQTSGPPHELTEEQVMRRLALMSNDDRAQFLDNPSVSSGVQDHNDLYQQFQQQREQYQAQRNQLSATFQSAHNGTSIDDFRLTATEEAHNAHHQAQHQQAIAQGETNDPALQGLLQQQTQASAQAFSAGNQVAEIDAELNPQPVTTTREVTETTAAVATEFQFDPSAADQVNGPMGTALMDVAATAINNSNRNGEDGIPAPTTVGQQQQVINDLANSDEFQTYTTAVAVRRDAELALQPAQQYVEALAEESRLWEQRNQASAALNAAQRQPVDLGNNVDNDELQQLQLAQRALETSQQAQRAGQEADGEPPNAERAATAQRAVEDAQAQLDALGGMDRLDALEAQQASINRVQNLVQQRPQGMQDMAQLIEEWRTSPSHSDFLDREVSHTGPNGEPRNPTPEELRNYAWHRSDNPGPNGEPPISTEAWHAAGANSNALTQADIDLIQQNRAAITAEAGRRADLTQAYEQASSAWNQQYRANQQLLEQNGGQAYTQADVDRLQTALDEARDAETVARSNFNFYADGTVRTTMQNIQQGQQQQQGNDVAPEERDGEMTPTTTATPVSFTGQIEVDGHDYTIAVRDGQPVMADADGNPLSQEEVAALRTANQQMVFVNVERNGTAMPDSTAMALEVMDSQGRIQLSQTTPNANTGQGQGAGR